MFVTFGLYEALIGIIFLCIIIPIIYVARDCFKKHKNKIDGYSAIVTAITSGVIGMFFLVEGLNCFAWSNYLYSLGLNQAALEYGLAHLILPYPTATFVIYFMPMIFLFMGAYVVKELISKNFVSETKISEKLSIEVDKSDLEVSRKTFHITIIAVIVCYLFLGKIMYQSIFQFIVDSTQRLYDLGYTQIPWQSVDISSILTNYDMAIFLIVFILAIICLLLIFTDFVRLSYYRFYPLKLVSQTYRKRERTSLGPHIYFVFGILFVVMFFPAQPATITIIISGIGDAFATIIGITFGKHKFKKGSSKTWEGGIGGVVSSLIFGILCYFLLMPIYGGSIINGTIMALVGAGLFFIIDYFSPPIKMSDNILNPLIIGFGTYLIYLLPII